MVPPCLAHDLSGPQRTGAEFTPNQALNGDAALAPLAVLARHGRSLWLAGWLLPRAVLADAAELYAFCRTVDGFADKSSDPAAARISLTLLRRRPLPGEGGGLLANAFVALQARTGVDPQAAALLVSNVLQNLGAVRVGEEAGLLRYAHTAAGTVRPMMCAAPEVAA